jgi:transposase
MTHKIDAIADRYGVSERVVRTWIEDGSLIALNVSAKRDSKKPRYVITDAAIALFEAARSTLPVATTEKVKRKPRLSPVPNYFGAKTG